MRVFSSLIRGCLDRLGYVLWKREFLRYGISPFDDILRLSRGSGRSVRTFFDVGANIGQTAREALDRFPAADIFAFEPHPDTFRRLTEVLRDKRLHAYQVALGDRDGEVTLYEYGSSGPDTLINSLVPDARFAKQYGYSAKECLTVCSTVDSFCEKYGIENIDILKIDTEGFDLFVMKGAARMLMESRVGFILTEYNDLQVQPGATGGALIPIAEYLALFGYRYVTSYTDCVIHKQEMFVCANALFSLPGYLRGAIA